MRITLRALALALLLVAAGCSTGDESGGCVRPGIDTVSPASASAGEPVHVTGGSFLAECGDTTDNGRSSTSKALDGNIRLTLTQGGKRFPLGMVRPAKDGTIAADVTVPAGVSPGKAEIVTDVAGAAGITLIVEKTRPTPVP